MITHLRNSLRNNIFLLNPSFASKLFHASIERCSHAPRSLSGLFDSSQPGKNPPFITNVGVNHKKEQLPDLPQQSEAEIIISKVCEGRNVDDILQSLRDDQACNTVQLSPDLVDQLLQRFKNDWKSALAVFRWAESCSGYKHKPEAYEMMVDILGKMKIMDRMMELLEEMNRGQLVTLKTVAKAMRRFSAARQWEDAVRIFDELGTYGLEKNTESMNLLLDALCKERKVEQAREIFLELKSHISPDARTFNIFINGWCIVNRVDEAFWTIQEMKGHGCHPCNISYSTIIQCYCRQSNYVRVYELLDEMEAHGCPPNVVTYTGIMSSLAKSEKFKEALEIAQRVKSAGYKCDTRFYNSLIHTLGRLGRLQEAVNVFEVEMPNMGVSPDTSTYNSIIAMFCRHAQEQKALNLLKQMERSMLCKPDGQTYCSLLKSCFRTGNMVLLSQLLDSMVKKHNISLDISAYMLLIHGLCKANKCEWAYQLFEEMVEQDMIPRHQTCRLLLEEVKLKNMHDAAERIQGIMNNL